MNEGLQSFFKSQAFILNDFTVSASETFKASAMAGLVKTGSTG